jgi:predicted small lipoprotein YifL
MKTQAMKTRAIIAIAALVLLSACGKRGDLKPAGGEPLPPKPATAARQPSANDLLTPDTQERPVRDDELVTKSQPLAPDRFDLPPPG